MGINPLAVSKGYYIKCLVMSNITSGYLIMNNIDNFTLDCLIMFIMYKTDKVTCDLELLTRSGTFWLKAKWWFILNSKWIYNGRVWYTVWFWVVQSCHCGCEVHLIHLVENLMLHHNVVTMVCWPWRPWEGFFISNPCLS